MRLSLHALLFTAISLFSFSTAQSQQIFALAGNDLVTFSADNPQLWSSQIGITGIPEGHTLEAIDFRPATGQLFGLAYNQMSGSAQLVIIDKATAMAMPVGMMPVMLAPNMGSITMDFNPTVDRIRVMGSNGSNYRMHPITGAIAATDMNLVFATNDINAGATPMVISGAYTNSYIGATSTRLMNFDAGINAITFQNPPNNGTQNTIGSIGISLESAMSNGELDIFYNSQTSANEAWFVGREMGMMVPSIYMLNLDNGMVSNGMALAGDVSDIAIEIIFNPAPVMGRLVYGLTSNNYLITFDSAMPSSVYSHKSISGIAAGQTIVGMDVRPANSMIYVLGYNSTSGEARLYTLDPSNGVATAIGDAAIMLATGLGKVSMDFNPVVDRVRVTSSSNMNYRLHPDTGVLVSTDMPLHFADMDVNATIDPSIGTGAYINSYVGAMATVLYNYDDSLNVFTTQVPPNDGVLNTVGSSGIMVNLMNPSSDLDIFFMQPGNNNMALFTANTGTSDFDRLYAVDLSNGMAMDMGMIGWGSAIVDIAASYMPVDFEAPMFECLADMTEMAGDMCMTALPDYTSMIMATDNMPGDLMVMQSPEPGTMISEMTEVMIMVADMAGNMSSCSFMVSVEDMTAPMIMCPANIMQANVFGASMVYVEVPEPMVMDNCDIAELMNDFNGMSSASGWYPVGTTNVQFMVVDGSGNMSQCTIQVTVDAMTAYTGDLILAITDDEELIGFSSDMPSDLYFKNQITGLMEGQSIVGFDARPANGELFVLGYNDNDMMGQLYVLDPMMAALMPIGTGFMIDLGNGEVAMDFNPTVDRIRVVAENDMNYRLNPVTGALAATDLNLNYAAGDVNAMMDPTIGAAAYINSYNGATMTSLFDYDLELNALSIQSPPNDGVLNTVGMSGISFIDSRVDMDIYYDLETMVNRAYFSGSTMSLLDELYSVNTQSGMMTSIGMIGDGEMVKDIAVFIDSVAVVGVEEVNALIPLGVYPNPASEIVTVALKGLSGELVLRDIMGREVWRSQSAVAGNQTISVQNLANGVYQLTLSNQEGIIANKLIEVR